MKKNALIVLMALILSSCAGYILVPGGKEIEIGNGMFVQPSQDWSKTADGDVDVWTLDGPMLQQIIFVKGAEDGDYLIPIRMQGSLNLQKDVPRIEKGMTSIEVLELFEDTFTRMGAEKIVLNNIKPFENETNTGFQFDFEFLTAEGLSKIGRSVGVLKNDKLFMAIYSGSRIYYFDRGIDDFQKIVRTLRVS